MLIGQSLGPFRVERELGAGAMGAVYLASFTRPGPDAPPPILKLAKVLQPGQRVAVKVMAPGLGSTNPNAIKRFEREAAILKQMKHLHIVRVYAVGKEKGTRYYAMELIEGESLDKILSRRGRLTWEEVVALGQQLCAALQHAHDQGIVHRDLKPSNLMILRDGTLKLTDFGIAKDLDVTALTSANCTVGTAAYMSPEQCRGEPNLTHKSDLYSLGVVFYELVTGFKPFHAESAMDMFMQHVKGTFERPSRRVLDIPIWLDTLICQLLEKAPDQRPRDAGTVGLALASIQEKVEAQQSAGVDAARRRVIDRTLGETRPDAEDRTAALSLLGVKVRPRRKKKKAFHEKVWVRASGLLLVLAVVVGALYLAFRPPPPEALFQRAQKLMASSSAEDHEKAMEGPIREYLLRYESRQDDQTAQIKKWADDYDVEQCESKIHTFLERKRNKRPYPPQDSLEEQAFKAAEEEEEGELKEARAVWEKLDSAGSHRWHLLAQRHIEQLDWVKETNASLLKYYEAIEKVGQVPPMNDPLEARAFLATRYEQMGDLTRASNHFLDIKKELAADRSKRGWYLLAAEKVQKLDRRLKDAPPGKDEREAKLKMKLEEAKVQQGMSNDKLRKAKALCINIIDLYGPKSKDPELRPLLEELQPLVKQAQDRLERVCKLLGDPLPS